MKKLHVNKEACIGCGACVAIDNSHFDFGDDGLSEVISEENIDTKEVANAIASCPTNAISMVEEKDEAKEGCDCCKDKKCCCQDEEAA